MAEVVYVKSTKSRQVRKISQTQYQQFLKYGMKVGPGFQPGTKADLGRSGTPRMKFEQQYRVIDKPTYQKYKTSEQKRVEREAFQIQKYGSKEAIEERKEYYREMKRQRELEKAKALQPREEVQVKDEKVNLFANKLNEQQIEQTTMTEKPIFTLEKARELTALQREEALEREARQYVRMKKEEKDILAKEDTLWSSFKEGYKSFESKIAEKTTKKILPDVDLKTYSKSTLGVFGVVGYALKDKPYFKQEAEIRKGMYERLREKPVTTTVEYGVGGGLGYGVRKVSTAKKIVPILKKIPKPVKKGLKGGSVVGLGVLYSVPKTIEIAKAPPEKRFEVVGGSVVELGAFTAGYSRGARSITKLRGTTKKSEIPKTDKFGRVDSTPKEKPSDLGKPISNKKSGSEFQRGRFIKPTPKEGKISVVDTKTGKRVVLSKEQYLKTSDPSYKPSMSASFIQPRRKPLFMGKKGSMRMGVSLYKPSPKMVGKVQPKSITPITKPRGVVSFEQTVFFDDVKPKRLQKGKSIIQQPSKRTIVETGRYKPPVRRKSTSIETQKPTKELIRQTPKDVDVYKPRKPPSRFEPRPLKPRKPTQIEPRLDKPIEPRKPTPIEPRLDKPIEPFRLKEIERTPPKDITDPSKPRKPDKPRKPRKPTTPGDVFIPGLPFKLPKLFGGGGGYGFKLPKSTRAKGRKKYVPSLIATTFDIYGKKPRGLLTGLEFRPIVGTKPKTNKKRKRLLFDFNMDFHKL